MSGRSRLHVIQAIEGDAVAVHCHTDEHECQRWLYINLAIEGDRVTAGA